MTIIHKKIINYKQKIYFLQQRLTLRIWGRGKILGLDCSTKKKSCVTYLKNLYQKSLPNDVTSDVVSNMTSTWKMSYHPT